MPERKVRIAINGFGRIGRGFFRHVFQNPDYPQFDIVAINDLGSLENLLYLLHYDSVYGRYGLMENGEVRSNSNGFTLANCPLIAFSQEKDLTKLPWRPLSVDIVVDSTGVFVTKLELNKHLDAGARRVVLTAPPKDDIPIATPNVGEELLQTSDITSNSSCTTNALAPLAKVFSDWPGIEKAIANTTHAYTASQALVDGPDRKDDFRRARAAAINMSPSETGAAKAVGKILPALAGKFDGIAVRVPLPTVSLVDLTFVADNVTDVHTINEVLFNAAHSPEWKDILAVTNEPIVSSDVVGLPVGSLVDLEMTRVVDGNLVKVMSWYDNEAGYCAMLAKHVAAVAKLL